MLNESFGSACYNELFDEIKNRYQHNMLGPIPVALSIAGSDCSAGAGIQADLKTFQHFGVHGLTAVTCVVSETASTVRAIHPIPVDVLRDQITLLLESFPVAAVKTGMLFSAAHVLAVAEILRTYPDLPVIVDPVMIASAGTSLMESGALSAYRDHLLPLAFLTTPNLPEAEALLGKSITTEAELLAAAEELFESFGNAYLVKGGHLNGDNCVDILAHRNGSKHYSALRIPVKGSHGTGCTLSSAITAGLALGLSLPAAIGAAKEYLGDTLRHSYEFQKPGRAVITALNQGTTLAKSVRDITR